MIMQRLIGDEARALALLAVITGGVCHAAAA
jgi:hypothetical protein